MENENLENVSAPETEEIQETVEAAVEVAETAEVTEAAPAESKKSITDILACVADKGKELIENPKPLLDKIKAVPKKIWIAIGGGVAALIAIIVVISLLSNTYKTPIKAAEKVLNSKSVNQVLNRAPALLNGFGEDEAKVLIGIAKKTDYYKDYSEDIEDGFESVIEMLEENVGKNYKISLKVTDKEKLEKDDLKAFRTQLRSIGKMGSMLEDMENEDYADMADELGISKAQAKKAVKNILAFCKDCKSAKVQKGYELTIEVKLTGKELDEPIEQEIHFDVFKVDGRWVPGVFTAADKVMDGLGMGDLMGIMGSLGGGMDIGDLMGGF
ncbi:MAG: hypothetical protein IJZ15_06000 [Oscillospiraceae bacterium]|nr:hypothetical protein [Oscillospiraceae bacterium]